jgi:hypothetical protein
METVELSLTTELSEAVECGYRKWWLRKDSKFRVIKSVVIAVLVLAVFFHFTNQTSHLSLGFIFLIALYPILIWWQYGPGYKRVIKKALLNQIGPDKFPATIEVVFSENGIELTQFEIKQSVKWDKVVEIRPYKEYHEFFGPMFLLQIKQSKLLEIERVKSFFNASRASTGT